MKRREIEDFVDANNKHPYQFFTIEQWRTLG